jgi:hypothetical protein
MTTSTSLWVVTAEFTDRDDAVALIDLARELGIVAQLSSRTINEKNGGMNTPARTWRTGKVLLNSMVPGRSYGLEHFMAALEEAGYKASSASPVLGKLVDQGDVERLGSGVYRLLKAREAIALCADCHLVEVCAAIGCQKAKPGT